MYALAAVLAAYSSRWGSLAGIVVPIVTCGAIGLVQGTLIGKLRMPAFIVTLAGLLFARGLAFKVSDNGNTTHLIDRGRWMTNLGQERVFGVGAPVGSPWRCSESVSCCSIGRGSARPSTPSADRRTPRC